MKNDTEINKIGALAQVPIYHPSRSSQDWFQNKLSIHQRMVSLLFSLHLRNWLSINPGQSHSNLFMSNFLHLRGLYPLHRRRPILLTWEVSFHVWERAPFLMKFVWDWLLGTGLARYQFGIFYSVRIETFGIGACLSKERPSHERAG